MDLHQHPELSGKEVRTAACLADALEAEGFDVTRNMGGHGVVGVLVNGIGRRVMVRTELDALPVEEKTGLPYSAVGIRAHACGHDLHIAAVLGAASLLARSRKHWQGTLVVVGQPAEETLSGARALLEDGLYARFGRPDVVLAQHSAPLLAGMVAHGTDGTPVLAGSAGLEVTLHGRGGHAGASHLTVNPVLTAASVALKLQSVVEQVCTPGEIASLTIGSLHAGLRSNVIPDRATMGVSIRGYSQATIDRVIAAVRHVAGNEAAASGSPRPVDVSVVSRSVATIPDPVPAGLIRQAHREAFGLERVMRWAPSMATEDFPLYGEAGRTIHGCERVPLCYWMFGTVGPRQWAETTGSTASERLASVPPNHSPGFAPHLPTALPAATAAMTTAALTQLKQASTAASP
ncbi:amidohydrolase [Streptomyces rubiginosohelvolus]|uniref:amidohydrolase n=1 Tax=Streptomyces rubiginosohelvolus TaxID=67362 RepID=UPI00371DD973